MIVFFLSSTRNGEIKLYIQIEAVEFEHHGAEHHGACMCYQPTAVGLYSNVLSISTDACCLVMLKLDVQLRVQSSMIDWK